MYWILAGLLVVIAWTSWFVSNFSVWIPAAFTLVIALLALALVLGKRVRAARAGTALERAIAEQGVRQAVDARPERRAEIQELQKQIQTGIDALKQSKLGTGSKGGAGALYSLPWFVIVGPPGAGKTTALKHSGLVFPYREGAIRGVGGTRNCDWWFTNEAILLDTAGRYTTEQDDHDEWIAFLQMLRKYRSKTPINGVLVAISVTELIDASEQELEVTGKKIRARIDEVMTQLQMIVPVYVLFTKCDLIAGFSEFFGDLRKSDRAQALGATLKLDLDKTDPGKIFDQEFDLLVKQVHARALKRLSVERNREAREKILQFPLEFAAIKRSLSELAAHAFAVNTFQGTPILRGFYFTSGTQEGRPLDRVLGRMGQAMGIRPAEAPVQQHAIESKSFFLHDVFTNVVFPDGGLAERSAGELRRQRFMRAAIGAAALALAVIAALPGVVSFLNNRRFLRETEERVRAASVIDWADGRAPQAKLRLLVPVHERLLEIDKRRSNGVEHEMGWFMYQGETVYRSTTEAYATQLQRGFVEPCKRRLEAKLAQVTGKKYLDERIALKKYLMLTDVEHLDVDWATGHFTSLWAEHLRQVSTSSEAELKQALAVHVHHYFKLLKAKKVAPVPLDKGLIDRARKTLRDVPIRTRYYDLFVQSIRDRKSNDDGDDVPSNRKYPPLTLNGLFADRPGVLAVLTSAQYEKEKRWMEIEGPYTEKGHYAVVRNIHEGFGYLESEQWVVPLTAEETRDGVMQHLRYLAADYDQKYIHSWTDWMGDLPVKAPQDLKEAVELYRTLSTPDWPYLRILRALEDHTQWTKSKSVFENEELNRQLAQKARTGAEGATGFKLSQSDFDLMKVGEQQSAVPKVFAKAVAFGVPRGRSAAQISSLANYLSALDALKGDMLRADPNTDPRVFAERLEEVRKHTETLLKPIDAETRQLLSRILLDPLKVAGASSERPSR